MDETLGETDADEMDGDSRFMISSHSEKLEPMVEWRVKRWTQIQSVIRGMRERQTESAKVVKVLVYIVALDLRLVSQLSNKLHIFYCKACGGQCYQIL